MLSIVLYGRNDEHGYNYHKRLAISLNAIAEVLTDPEDEILFTDDNSPDDYPTILEAIQDTLTQKARSLIRIFRIRNRTHRRHGALSQLLLLEPIARNVAIRRSNPKNRWILSTNADMLFVPCQAGDSLTNIVAELPDGFYALPRFEIPEQIWESHFDRMQPQKTLCYLKENSARLHLNTVVRTKGFLAYDNPGDFQLFLREDLFKLQGFDERMLKGWHVDANLCKRASLILRPGPSLEEKLLAFHCNHTRTATPSHVKNSVENDWNLFVNNPDLQACPTQENWGLAQELLEEIDLKGLTPPICALSQVLSSNNSKEEELHIGAQTYNTLTYSSPRILTYLSDHLRYLPRTAQIVYFGHNTELTSLLCDYLKQAGFQNDLLISSTNPAQIQRAAVLIFDFGFDATSQEGLSTTASKEGYRAGKRKMKQVMQAFFRILKYRGSIRPETKWIGIHVTQTDFYALFKRHLAICTNALVTGICYGYLPRQKHRAKISLRSAKKQLLTLAHYSIVRYFFDYADPIRTYLLKSPLGKHIKKTTES